MLSIFFLLNAVVLHLDTSANALIQSFQTHQDFYLEGASFLLIHFRKE